MSEVKYDLRPYLDYLCEKAPRAYEISPAPEGELRCAQERLRAKLTERLNLSLYGERETTPRAAVEETVQCDGYTREKLTLSVAPGLDMPLYVLRPDGATGRLPLAVALYGHSCGACDVLGLPDARGRESRSGYQKFFPIELAKRGMLVAVPELAGFGELRINDMIEDGKNGGDCYPVSGILFQLGGSTAGLRVYQVQRVLDFMTALPEADGSRAGCIGISGGGTVATHAAAADLRFKAAVISGYVNFYKTSILAMHHCIDNFVPGLLEDGELPDILSLIAPRHMLISHGSEDRGFPVEHAKRAAEQVRRVYAAFGCEDRLRTDFFEGGHMISGEAVFGFLPEVLG